MTDQQSSLPATYVTALRVDDLLVDHTYQRDVDQAWVRRAAPSFDVTLLGVLEVSDRGGGQFAIIDGQHRAELVREAHPEHGAAHVVVQVHRGLTPQQEAALFHQIAAKRKQMTWWDLWKSLRASGDPDTAAIENVLAGHGLQVNPAAKSGNVRAVAALRKVVADLGGLPRLDEVLAVVTTAFGTTVDAFDGATLIGVALILDRYDYRGGNAELDLTRLVDQMQTITPRQLRARAVALREAHNGEQPRLFAAVIIGLYNAARGRTVEDFLTRVPSGTRKARPAARPPAPPAPAPAVARPVPAPPRPVTPPRPPTPDVFRDLSTVNTHGTHVCATPGCGHRDRFHDEGGCEQCACTAYTTEGH